MSLQQLLKNIPFVRFAFSLGIGIFFAEYFEKSDLPILFLCFGFISFFLFLTILLPSISQKYSNRWMVGTLFFLILFLLGVILSLFSRASRVEGQYKVFAKARVIEGDVTYSGYYRFVVEPLEFKTNDSLLCGSNDYWQIIVEPEDSFLILPANPGNIVAFRTRLSGHSPNKNPDVFDYGKYLFRQGISATGFVSGEDFNLVEKTSMDGLLGSIKSMRGKVCNIYRENGINGEKLQVLSALTLGMRQMLDDELKSSFIHSGAIHVLAVSGLHVGVIFIIVNWVLSFFVKRRSLVRVVIVLSVLVFFAILTGGAPSVFRAVIMLSVIQIGNYAEKKGNIYNLLGLSAFIILMAQPMALFNAGFWLSHLAVAGIVTFYPFFHQFYAGKSLFLRGVGDLVSVSLAAQLGTFPLSLFVFKAFPSWFLLSNVFVLPLVAPILIFAKLLILFSSQSVVAMVFAGVLNELLGFMIEVVKWLNGLPFAYLQGIWLGSATMVLFYIVLISSMMWHHFKIRVYLKSTLLGVLFIIVILNVEYWKKRNTDGFVVFDSGRTPLIANIRSGGASLFSNSETTDRNLNFICSGFFARNALRVENKSLFKADGAAFQANVYPSSKGYYLGLGDMNLKGLKVATRYKDSILGVILLGNIKGDVERFLKSIGKPVVILTDSCPKWCRDKWLPKLETSGIEIYNVSEAGAFLFLDVPLSWEAFLK